ncbi:MAG TPA: hypothetical protein VF290_02500 [Pyrinomonadaceae bacterium]
MANYWNSTIRIKPGAKRLKRSEFKRVPGTARLERKPLQRSTKPINKLGRRGKNWRKAWRFLKPELEKRGRTQCEFKFIPHECFGPLDPCHSKKRRKMEGNDIYTVAIGCRWIHNFLDYSCTHEQMELFVLHAIDLAGGMILPAERKAA